MVDAVRFEQLVGAGQALFSGGEAAAAADRFRQALGMWRGRALADVCELESLAREAARLEELRLAAMEGRIEADIALGLHAEVTGGAGGPGRGVSAAGAVVAAAGPGAIPGRAAG